MLVQCLFYTHVDFGGIPFHALSVPSLRPFFPLGSSPPLRLEGLGELPKRVRTEPGRQTYFGAF